MELYSFRKDGYTGVFEIFDSAGMQVAECINEDLATKIVAGLNTPTKEVPLIVTGPVPEFKRHFEVGKTYLRADGKKVKIIAEANTNLPNFCVVQGDDGEDIENRDSRLGFLVHSYGATYGWRTDRPDDIGRVTGSDLSDPRNLIPGEII